MPDVPGSAASKVVEVEYASLEDKRLRAQLKDPGFIEAQTTALQISSLKRISKGTKVSSPPGGGVYSRRVCTNMHSRCLLFVCVCMYACVCLEVGAGFMYHLCEGASMR